MALSGTVTFSQTRDQLVTDALLDVGQVGLGQAVDSDLIQFAVRKLQMMLKAWMADGLQLWKIKETTLFLEKYKNYYQLGPTGDNCTADKPIYKGSLTSALVAGSTTINVDNTAAQGFTNNKFNSAALVTGMYVGIQQTDNSMYWTTVSTVPNGTSFTIPGPGLTSAYRITLRKRGPMRSTPGYCVFAACFGSLTNDGNSIFALALSRGQTVTCLPFCHWISTPVTRPSPYLSAWVYWSFRP